jgi:hypothetical protein
MAGPLRAILHGDRACRLVASTGCSLRRPNCAYNLIFHRRPALDKLGERLLDANRTIGQQYKITVIRSQSHQTTSWQTANRGRRVDLPNPVIRSQYRNGFIKRFHKIALS